MQRKAQSHNSIFGIAWNSVLALMLVLLVLTVVVLFIVFTAQPAQGQTYKVLYNFTGGKDGANPAAGLTMDKGGNLYGTASSDLWHLLRFSLQVRKNCFRLGPGPALRLCWW